MKKIIYSLLTAVVAFSASYFFQDYNNNETLSSFFEQQSEYTFRYDDYLQEHFEKHRSEFNYSNAQEYLQGANDLINNDKALTKKEAEDNDDIYFLTETNEFVVVSTDGYIRTYFIADAGIDYYNKQ